MKSKRSKTKSRLMKSKRSKTKTRRPKINTRRPKTKTRRPNTESQSFFSLQNLPHVPRQIRSTCITYDVYRIDDSHILGEGSYGKVVPACTTEVCDKVAKVITFDMNRYPEFYRYNVFFAECLITKFAGDHMFGIPIQAYYLCDEGKKGIIIMDRYTQDLLDINSKLTWPDMKQLLDKVNLMHSFGILHRDLFLKNTMYKRHKDQTLDIRIIDFGMSIAFEKRIPGVFRAIDFLNLISDLENADLKRQCRSYIEHYFVSRTSMKQAESWINTHYASCQSEYSLLRHIPLSWIQLIGPATVDTMVWSVRCDPKLDKDIVDRTRQKVAKVLSN